MLARLGTASILYASPIVNRPTINVTESATESVVK